MKHLCVLLPLLLGACVDHSFAVVGLLAYSGTIESVSQFRVRVSNASAEDVLLYPQQASQPLRLDTERPVTLSVEFDVSKTGETTFEVEALSGTSAVLGYGKATVSVGKHGVFRVVVRVVPGAVRPERPLDGGVSSDGPSPLSCDPLAPAVACGPGQTCGILCTSNQPAAAMCYLAGAGNPGDPCTSNRDCAPGSQCFTFSARGCSVMTCLRFCGNDLACGQTDAYCNVPIQCGTPANRSACSRPCDPVTGSGCTTGLSCYVYDGETTDCGCPGQGTVGSACTQNTGCNGEDGCSGCGAGLSCVIPTGTDAGANEGICRPICRIATSSCPIGTTCRAFENSSRRLYGFCQ